MGTSRHMDLFLVRHAITDWNKQKRYVGHTDRKVVKSKLSQLANLQKALQKISFDYVYTSDLRRCQETIAYLHIPAHIIKDARLREMNFGDWEGKTYDELKDEKTYQDWLENWEANSIPNGESADAFKSRIDSFLIDLFTLKTEKAPDEKKQILVVTHGGVIRYIVSKYVASSAFWELSVIHGQGVQLSFNFIQQKGEWECSSLLAVPFQGKER
ncbi:histidine phosphatase family protein [Fredinandcohnia humi]